VAELAFQMGLIVEYDKDGRAMKSWRGDSGRVKHLSEAFLYEGYLYLGSPYAKNAFRVKYEE